MNSFVKIPYKTYALIKASNSVKILSFYGYLHEAYLLFSLLCKHSREVFIMNEGGYIQECKRGELK